jgi:hypothetical protein
MAGPDKAPKEVTARQRAQLDAAYAATSWKYLASESYLGDVALAAELRERLVKNRRFFGPTIRSPEELQRKFHWLWPRFETLTDLGRFLLWTTDPYATCWLAERICHRKMSGRTARRVIRCWSAGLYEWRRLMWRFGWQRRAELAEMERDSEVIYPRSQSKPGSWLVKALATGRDICHEFSVQIEVAEQACQYDRALLLCEKSVPLLPAVVEADKEEAGEFSGGRISALELGCAHWTARGQADKIQEAMDVIRRVPELSSWIEALRGAYGRALLARRVLQILSRRPGCAEANVARFCAAAHSEISAVIGQMENVGILRRVRDGEGFRLHIASPSSGGE